MPSPENVQWMVETLGILSWRDDNFEAFMRWGYVTHELNARAAAVFRGEKLPAQLTKTELAALAKKILDEHGPSPGQLA